MSSSDRRLFLISALALTGAGLGACGFAPAYGPTGGAGRLTGQVAMADPGNRADYLLLQRIEERLGAGGARYLLDTRPVTRSQGLGTTPDGKTTRYHLAGSAAYTLTDAATGAELTKGEVSAFTGYSATGSTVATLAAERDARERLMVMLADRIVDRLILTAPDLPA